METINQPFTLKIPSRLFDDLHYSFVEWFDERKEHNTETDIRLRDAFQDADVRGRNLIVVLDAECLKPLRDEIVWWSNKKDGSQAKSYRDMAMRIANRIDAMMIVWGA